MTSSSETYRLKTLMIGGMGAFLVLTLLTAWLRFDSESLPRATATSSHEAAETASDPNDRAPKAISQTAAFAMVGIMVIMTGAIFATPLILGSRRFTTKQFLSEPILATYAEQECVMARGGRVKSTVFDADDKPLATCKAYSWKSGWHIEVGERVYSAFFTREVVHPSESKLQQDRYGTVISVFSGENADADQETPLITYRTGHLLSEPHSIDMPGFGKVIISPIDESKFPNRFEITLGNESIGHVYTPGKVFSCGCCVAMEGVPDSVRSLVAILTYQTKLG